MLFFLPVIWLSALVDSLILTDRVNHGADAARAAGIDSTNASIGLEEELKVQNSKIFAVALSMIPGAGHMFMGQMGKGIQLMAAFFLTLYFSDFLNVSLLLMIAPILWFYSVFDVFHKISHPEKYQDPAWIEGFFKGDQFSGKAGKYLGIGLVLVGCIMILQRIIMPQLAILLNAQIVDYLRTGVIAILFIAGGIKLMMGSKEKGDKKA